MMRFRHALLFLLLAAVAPAAAQDSNHTPFTSGVTDAASLQTVVEARLTRARQLLDELLAVKGRRTVANTLAPYDELSGELYASAGLARVMAALHPDEAMRRAGEDLNRRAQAVAAEVALRRDVFDALNGIDRRGADPKTRYYLERELKEFKLSGVDRPEATRTRIKQLRDELTGLMDEFARNIAQKPRQVTVSSVAELDGLPPDFVARHKPDANGVITLTTNPTDDRPVMIYAKSGELRRRMTLAVGNIAAPENIPVLAAILRVRFELARLLGYPNWAEYDAASRMAGDVETVSRFIDRVVAASGPKAAREIEELTRRKQQDFPGSSLNLWDRQYYSELVRRASYDFDSQSVRPYFPFERVLQGVLDLTGTIFGVSYRPVTGVPVWHPAVRVYEMHSGSTLVGRIYLDLHPRPNKRASGGNANAVNHGQEGRSIPEIVMAASIPGGDPGDPGLLTHDDVRMLFHELGHVVHRLTGGHQPWQKLSSLAVERDFTEAPSQMLEEWAWDARVLATFAKHYQTGEPIPAALVERMRRAGEFGQAYDVRQQMLFARAALTYHERDPSSLDQADVWKQIHSKYVPIPFAEGTNRQASFPHIGQAGYASAYYSYMWAFVIAKDMFSRFGGADLLAPGVAQRYRQTIFEPGSSKPAADLMEDFLGRPFTFDAWERWLNGVDASDASGRRTAQ